MSYQTITIEITGRSAQLTLNRPEKLNAFNDAMLQEMLSGLAEIAANDDVNVLTLTGAGRAFCAGVDTRSEFFLQSDASGATTNGGRDFTVSLFSQHRMIRALAEMPQVTIAAVHGMCVGGGGFGMAMACDMRIASQDAKFWMIPGKVGVVQDFGIPWFLERLIGTAKTLELMLSGDVIDGAQAAALGIVNKCVAPGELASETAQLAGKISAGAPLGIRMAKQSVYRGLTLSLAEQLDTEAISNGLLSSTEDAREGFAAYRENRPAKFTGR